MELLIIETFYEAKKDIIKAIWVASEMRAGAVFAHATIAMAEMEK